MLALAAQLVAGAEFTALPVMAPYAPVPPLDGEYPANLPAGLPTALPSPPPALKTGTLTRCTTSVADVLRANKRNALLALLAQSQLGSAVLSGLLEATIIAPPDAALAQMGITPDAVAANPLLPTTIAHYHVLQGVRSLSGFGVVASRVAFNGYNTTLTEAHCPTAFQTVNVLKGGAFGTLPSDLFVRSAESTARVTAGDIPACNSVVHLLDGALQPCCTSLYEMLGEFSIVQITPSYFDGYKKPAPAENTDAFNRRLFEEQLLDMLLVRAGACRGAGGLGDERPPFPPLLMLLLLAAAGCSWVCQQFVGGWQQQRMLGSAVAHLPRFRPLAPPNAIAACRRAPNAVHDQAQRHAHHPLACAQRLEQFQTFEPAA